MTGDCDTSLNGSHQQPDRHQCHIVDRANEGKSLHIHSLEKGGLKTICKYDPKHSVNIKQANWCHDNTYIAILPENGHPQILSAKDPSHLALVHTISSIPDVSALRFKSNTKRVLALGTRGGQVLLYDTKNRTIIRILAHLQSEINALGFSSVNDLAAISNDILALFSLADSGQVELRNTEMCSAMKCLKNNNIAVGCVNGTVTVWDTNSRSENTYRFHSAEITGIAASDKERLLITAGTDNKICVIDQSRQECIFRKMLHQPVTSIDISANEQHLVAGLQDGSIYVYQMADHLKPQICFKMHPDSIHQISFVNELTFDALESDSFMDDVEVENAPEKDTENTVGSLEIAEFDHEPSEIDDANITQEQVKLDLIKLINAHFNRLEDQLADHCAKLQSLVCAELDSLYAVAARWECFKTMELEEIVRYICGIVSAASETRIVSHKSDHTNLQQE